MQLSDISNRFQIPRGVLQEYAVRLYGVNSNITSISILILPLLIKLMNADTSVLVWKAIGLCRMQTNFAYLPSRYHHRQQNALRLQAPLNVGIRTHAWAEVSHCKVQPFQEQIGSKGAWFYVAPGSGVSIRVGNTAIVDESLFGDTMWNSQVQEVYQAIKSLSSFIQNKPAAQQANDIPGSLVILGNILGLCKAELLTLDSIQILHHQELDEQELHEIVFLAIDDVHGRRSTKLRYR